jgi:hypothetical protein
LNKPHQEVYMRLLRMIAVCCGIALCSSDAFAFGSTCSFNDFRNWPFGTLDLGNVTAVNGVVTFFYNNRVIPGNNTVAQFPLTTLGPFSLHVPGSVTGAPACLGAEQTSIPVVGTLIANVIE